MNTLIIGAGYVGAPSAAHYANIHKVTVFDIDESKIEKLQRVAYQGSRDLHIHEQGLIELLQKNQKRLKFTTDIDQAFKNNPEIIFNCVPTPQIKDGVNKNKADLKYICDAAKMIAKNLQNDAIVLNKSTVPPGTAFLTDKIIHQNMSGHYNITVGSCPEFLAEGTAIKDLTNPSRIVYGISGQQANITVFDFFRTLHHSAKIIGMSEVSSELTKYIANAMLAIRVSFMNSVARLCDEIGADVESVRKGIAADPRIGDKFLYASMGYGGSCFPKDTNAIAEFAKDFKLPLEIVDATICINSQTPENFYNKILNDSNKTLENKEFGLWGIGFKAGTDDLRESKPVEVAVKLMEQGAKMHIFDTVPLAMENFANEYEKHKESFTLYKSRDDIFSQNLSGLIIGNEDSAFRNPDLEEIARMNKKIIYDGKNILRENYITKLDEFGGIYRSVGRDSLTGINGREKLINFLETKYISN